MTPEWLSNFLYLSKNVHFQKKQISVCLWAALSLLKTLWTDFDKIVRVSGIIAYLLLFLFFFCFL